MVAETHASIEQGQVRALFEQECRQNYVRTDRVFAGLMLVQWAVSIAFAIFIAPQAWPEGSIPPQSHLYAALLLGGALTLTPVFLIWRRPGSTLTRHCVAVCQLSMSGLLIHLTGGRIETHFHIFGSLAFLAFYRDWRVILTATVVTAGDHLVRGTFFPHSLFGGHDQMHLASHLWHVVEHASYVIFEDIILVLGCLRNVQEMRATAARRAEVERTNQELGREKAGIELKIEEAVRDSERQKSYLSESVSHMLREMEKFAAGDLKVRLDEGREGDIGRLFQGFNRAVAKTGHLLRQVSETVNTAADAANQINSAAKDLEATAGQQSAQSEEVAAAVSEMTAAAGESAEVVRQAAQAATASGESAAQGRAVVAQAVSKMGRIAEVVRDSGTTVARLGGSSDEIGKIVSVIDDIADQTNLLALNAAIEAARAGEHGLGFAVVADEVRKLAERTSVATSQITQMIKGIQVETRRAVEAMGVGTREVEEGIDLSTRTGEALELIVSETRGMIGRVNQIAAISEEQAATNLQIAGNVEAISVSASSSAAGVSQIADAVGRLDGLTTTLRSLTSQFKLGANGHDPSEAWQEPADAVRAEGGVMIN